MKSFSYWMSVTSHVTCLCRNFKGPPANRCWILTKTKHVYMFYTHHWSSKLTYTHCCRGRYKTPEKRKTKLAWWNKAGRLRHSGCAYIYIFIYYVYNCVVGCRKIKLKLFIPVAFYTFLWWSDKLMEEHQLRVLENRMQRKMFECEKEDVTGRT
jgi:hypothetical protein